MAQHVQAAAARAGGGSGSHAGLLEDRTGSDVAGLYFSASGALSSAITSAVSSIAHHLPNIFDFQQILEHYTTNFLYGMFVLLATILAAFLLSELRLMHRKRRCQCQDGKATYTEIIQYRLDHYFSTSKWAKPCLLLSFTFVLIVFGALGLAIVDPAATATVPTATNPESTPNPGPLTTDYLTEAAWVAWTYVADPGTHADANGTLVRFVSFLITIGGMVIFALMIGIISDFISERVDDLKQGKSRVIESDHTLMLGWSDKSLAIIEQICLANESEGGGQIVVLANDSKQDMEAKLLYATERSTSEHQIKLLGTQVIFRSGNPLMEHELRKVSVATARSIIVLSPPEMDPDEADSLIVRQVLAIKAVLNGRGPHMVVEMQDIDNKTLVELVDSDQNKVEVVVAHDIIGRLMIQCAREPGLAHVLEGLLGFDGDEFYIEEWSDLVGKAFFDITCRFDDAVPIGIKRGRDDTIIINPPNDYTIRLGDKIICLAEDNDTYEVNDGSYRLDQGMVYTLARRKRKCEKLLFCGWRRDMADMISLLDELVVHGSELWLFNQVPVQERGELLKDKDNKEEVETKNLIIKNAIGSPIVRRNLRVLAALDSKGLPTGRVITLDEFDSILILSDARAPDTVSSDSRSLASLLLIQDLQQKIFNHKQKVRGRMAAFGNGGSSSATLSKSLRHLPPPQDQNNENEKSITGDEAELVSELESSAPSSPSLEVKIGETSQFTVESYRTRPCDPIGEILDTRTRSLLQVAGCKGYVMSNHIVSMMLASVAEDRDMNGILGELLSAQGSETKFCDISHYLDIANPQECKRSFWDVAVLARQRREVVFGYKPRDMSWTEAQDLMTNPPNKDKPITWEEGDIIVVLALD